MSILGDGKSFSYEFYKEEASGDDLYGIACTLFSICGISASALLRLLAYPFIFTVAKCGCPSCLSCSQVYKVPVERDVLQRHISRLRAPGNARARVRYIIDSKKRWRGESVDLSMILKHARNTYTSQPKDKIYAFLGLVHSKYNITIDYQPSYSINTLLTDTARAILLHERNGYDILLDAGTAAVNRRFTSSDDSLPSWVPDWTIEDDPFRHEFIESLRLPSGCNAGGQARFPPFFETDSAGQANRVLVLRGFQVDVLGELKRETYDKWRRFATVSGKYTVTTANTARRGDELWVLCGAKWPFVLRRWQEGRGRRVLLAVAGVFERNEYSQIMFGLESKTEREEEVQIV